MFAPGLIGLREKRRFMASEEIQKTSQNYTAAGNEMSASFLAAKERSAHSLAKLHENPATLVVR